MFYRIFRDALSLRPGPHIQLENMRADGGESVLRHHRNHQRDALNVGHGRGCERGRSEDGPDDDRNPFIRQTPGAFDDFYRIALRVVENQPDLLPHLRSQLLVGQINPSLKRLAKSPIRPGKRTQQPDLHGGRRTSRVRMNRFFAHPIRCIRCKYAFRIFREKVARHPLGVLPLPRIECAPHLLPAYGLVHIELREGASEALPLFRGQLSRQKRAGQFHRTPLQSEIGGLLPGMHVGTSRLVAFSLAQPAISDQPNRMGCVPALGNPAQHQGSRLNRSRINAQFIIGLPQHKLRRSGPVLFRLVQNLLKAQSRAPIMPLLIVFDPFPKQRLRLLIRVRRPPDSDTDEHHHPQKNSHPSFPFPHSSDP